ncbi:ATPase, V1 complex, subunit C [Gigaspora margarita]|uniref:V-type proton ATPase subunit C n=1 Tax=Gigaspora margarita TaxID=4874 RepID=A0A8H4A229_GIGMA|nr:ATPase, V1 complex, subunit C [Gigaspora margarita]
MSKHDKGTYWFISVPAEGNKSIVFQNLKAKLSGPQADLAEVYQFLIPEFKIGTLDALVVISDELVKYDQFVETVAWKIVDILRILLNGDIDKICANLLVNDKSVDQYLKTFQWDIMKFRAEKSLQEIAEILNEEVSSIDTLMKAKLAHYNQVKGSLQALEKKQTGNLSVRNVADFVKKEHFVLDSEYLETLLVAVPRNLYKSWNSKYETLTQYVVPRSSQKIAEDDEYGLFTVTLFKRIVTDFSNRCREEKFVYRDFKYNEDEMANQRKEFEEMGATEKELSSALLRLANTNFGEVFAAWIHFKAMKVYVESVLRYGLPPDFMSATIKPKYKMDKKIREILNNQYGKLGGALSRETQKDEAIEEYQNLIDKDYYPYVWFQIQFNVKKIAS